MPLVGVLGCRAIGGVVDWDGLTACGGVGSVGCEAGGDREWLFGLEASGLAVAPGADEGRFACGAFGVGDLMGSEVVRRWEASGLGGCSGVSGFCLGWLQWWGWVAEGETWMLGWLDGEAGLGECSSPV